MVVVIGGHTRNIGKTSVVCGVIRALPEWNWTAIKITQHGHGIRARDGEPAFSEENGSSPSTDSGRFLATGAARAFWIRTPGGELKEAMPGIRRILMEAGNTIIESNSILRFLKPDICAMVLDGSVPDFKATSRRFLDRANVLVVTSEAPLAWPDVPRTLLRDKPRFTAPPPSYQDVAFIDAIRQACALRGTSSMDMRR